jgi:hypothetical protein
MLFISFQLLVSFLKGNFSGETEKTFVFFLFLSHNWLLPHAILINHLFSGSQSIM